VAKYQVTAKNGRCGKVRQIEPFEVETKALPTDLDQLKVVVSKAIGKIIHDRGSVAYIDLIPGSADFAAEVFYDNQQFAGDLLIQVIEE